MLSVIVDARAAPDRLPPLLADLTTGVVERVVREVVIIGPREGLIELLCEDTGAEAEPTLAAALARTKSSLVLAMPADFRFREGWIERLQRFLAEGGKAAQLKGRGGLITARRGLLLERDRALGLGAADLEDLRRRLRMRGGGRQV